MTDPWLGIALVLGALGVLLAALSRTSDHHPELARKAVHVGMGFAVLTFPWLFARPWPVLVLAGVTTLAFIGLRLAGARRFAVGRTLHAVERPSLGEIHYVLGTCAVFLLAAGSALLYCVPMLVLAFADTAAALVGARYGRRTLLDGKTLEGSLAFCAVAWGCIWGVLVLVVPAPAGELAVSAVLVALMATAMEALGPRGLDNLLVPLGTFVALDASGMAELVVPGSRGVGVAIALVAAAALMALAALAALALPVARQPARATAPGGAAR
jgi:phytol kinase